MHSSDWLDIVYSCFHKRLLMPTPVKSDFVPQDLSLKCDREKNWGLELVLFNASDTFSL